MLSPSLPSFPLAGTVFAIKNVLRKDETMKKLKLKLSLGFLSRADKEALEKWRHLEFAMKKPTEKDSQDNDMASNDFRYRKNEIYFKNWNSGL